jgi:prefoldin subunit 5
VFSRYEDDHSVELYNEAQLSAAYKRLDDKRTKLNSDIASLKAQAGKLTKRERSKQRELQKQITALQGDLNSIDEDKAQLDEFYGRSESRERLFGDYESLQALAKNFGGRSYDINSPADRQAMKISMLSSLRPQALKILEEVASAYHRQFDRPLPVSSLVRPEQYQRALRRVNRNAIMIETPPHSTGLAFDIDYRYMSAAEQSFVMSELARMKTEGRIEVIRERNANYHVFAFVDGTRPSDDLITASLEEARGPVQQAHHATPPKRASRKSKKTANRTTKSRRPRSNAPKTRKRRR